MDVKLLLGFLLSCALLFVAIKYGIVAGGGAASRRQKQPVSYWIGTTVLALSTIVELIVLISMTLRRVS